MCLWRLRLVSCIYCTRCSTQWKRCVLVVPWSPCFQHCEKLQMYCTWCMCIFLYTSACPFISTEYVYYLMHAFYQCSSSHYASTKTNSYYYETLFLWTWFRSIGLIPTCLSTDKKRLIHLPSINLFPILTPQVYHTPLCLFRRLTETERSHRRRSRCLWH